MRVYEVAKEFNVSSEALVHLLREMDIPVRSHMTQLADEHVARLRTVLERERRLGHATAEEAIEAALGEAQTAPRRRRRRRAEQEEGAEAEVESLPTAEEVPTPTVAGGAIAEADASHSPTADAAEAMAAEAAVEAAERGAELV